MCRRHRHRQGLARIRSGHEGEEQRGREDVNSHALVDSPGDSFIPRLATEYLGGLGTEIGATYTRRPAVTMLDSPPHSFVTRSAFHAFVSCNLFSLLLMRASPLPPAEPCQLVVQGIVERLTGARDTGHHSAHGDVHDVAQFSIRQVLQFAE